MAIAAYGHLVAEDEVEVRYDLRADPDAAPIGVLIITKGEPIASWRVEGERGALVLAERVAARVRARVEDTGSWPVRAAHQA
jgi:hypothetical protein